MYHVKDDKRSKLSAELICNGFLNLIARTDYFDITISSIAEVSGVGRATFYRLFDNKEDILRYQMDMCFFEMYQQLLPQVEMQAPSEMQLLSQFFEFWLHRNQLIKMLIQANLFEQFQSQLLTFFTSTLTFIKNLLHINEKEWIYFISIRAAMLSTALSVAIQSFPNDAPSDIAQVVTRLFGIQQLQVL